MSLSHVVDLGVSADNTYLQEGLEVHLRDGNVPGLMSFMLHFDFSNILYLVFLTRKGCVEQRGVAGRSGELGDGGSASDGCTG